MDSSSCNAGFVQYISYRIRAGVHHITTPRNEKTAHDARDNEIRDRICIYSII